MKYHSILHRRVFVMICTGFLAIRSNSKTVNFIEGWRDYLAKHSQENDQIGFNRLNMSKVRINKLSRNHFPSGDLYFEEAGGKINHSEVVIVHNNFIIGHDKKLERFQQFHLWCNGTK